MSFFECAAPDCVQSTGAVRQVIRPHRKNLGEFSVARALPAPDRQMIGPFIFFDHMGPADFAPGQGIQVRPHPHIGIATITYLFEGLIMHRDSLGYQQPIEPGAVNLMVAGRGIVHSERAGEDLGRQSRLHGIQSWLALPDAELERDPSFTHYPAAQIPSVLQDGVEVTVIIGEAFGQCSPVSRFAETLYLEVRMAAGSRVAIPSLVTEAGVYVVDGELRANGHELRSGELTVMSDRAAMDIEALTACRLMVVGGEPVGPRILWWNFVAATQARIDQAGQEWLGGGFDRIDGDDEFIPLPER